MQIISQLLSDGEVVWSASSVDVSTAMDVLNHVQVTGTKYALQLLVVQGFKVLSVADSVAAITAWKAANPNG